MTGTDTVGGALRAAVERVADSQAEADRLRRQIAEEFPGRTLCDCTAADVTHRPDCRWVAHRALAVRLNLIGAAEAADLGVLPAG